MLNRFEMSISQLNLTSLEHLIGIAILSYYENGLNLTADHFDALLRVQHVSGLFVHRLVPHTNMSVTKGTISNGHSWCKCFFFVRINAAFVEEGFIPMFRSEFNNPPFINPFPRSLMTWLP